MNEFGTLDLSVRPMVSAIMPTYGRPALVGESVAMFLKQDYEKKELIILNDCAGQHFHFDHPAVKVINLPMRFPTLGQKRNACVEIARGEIIAVWDDDDVYLPWRLTHTVEQMLQRRTHFYRPAEYWGYWGDENLHHNHAVPHWPNHPFVAYSKQIWAHVGGYPSQDLCEDNGLFDRVHRLLEKSYIKYPIAKVERFGVLRGCSPYKHMSISGGLSELDTTPGDYPIHPTEIADVCLRNAVGKLEEAYRGRHAVLRTNSKVQVTREPNSLVLSVCVSLKNRSRIAHGNRHLELFPQAVKTLAEAATCLNPGQVELVVADFASDDWPLDQWIDQNALGLKLKVLQLEGDFSRGRGLNVAVNEASSDRLLLLDADMLTTPELLLSGIRWIDQKTVYFPIFRYLGEDGSLRELETRSYGNAFLSREQYRAVNGIVEFNSWGGEDEILYERLCEVAAIERSEAIGFHHQWHPERSRHEFYLHAPHSDFHQHRVKMGLLPHAKVFSARCRHWQGQLSLHPSGFITIDGTHAGTFEWNGADHMTLRWYDWPPEEVSRDCESGRWQSTPYRFSFDDLTM